MEHDGGNNSSFTIRVVTSASSDIYSTMTAAMESLKGFQQGGANLKFISMMGDIREHVNDQYDRDEVTAYIEKIVNKEAFDRIGLVYGIGHAVYTLSEPREITFKEYFYSGAVYYNDERLAVVLHCVFAIAIIVGWSAHRLEESITSKKIIHPAYKSVMKFKE